MLLMAERYATGGLSYWCRKFSVVLKFFFGYPSEEHEGQYKCFKKKREKEREVVFRKETPVLRKVIFGGMKH